MTVPMIVLAVGSVVRRRPAGHGGPAAGLARPRSFGEPEEADARDRAADHRHRRCRRDRCSAVGWPGCSSAAGTVPVDRAGAGLARSTAPPARNLYADAFNEAVFMRPGQWLDPGAGLLRQPRRRRRWSTAWPPALGGSSARLRRAADRLRPRPTPCRMLGGAVLVAGALLAVTAG